MKALILANNNHWTTWDAKLKQFKDWFAPSLTLDITLEHTAFQTIDWATDTDSNGNSFLAIAPKWYDDNISIPAVKRGYDAVLFVVEPSVWQGKQVQGLGTKPNVGIEEISMVGNENAEYNFNGIPYPGGQFFNIARHELIHRIYDMLGKQDNCHLYFNNGNLEQCLKELSEPKTKVTINRFRDDGVQSLGDLTVKDFACKTLERSWKNNQSNISCVPVGQYCVRWTFSLRLMRYTYELQNVPGRSGIRIHSANFWSQLLGCIALGDSYGDLNHDAQADILNSRVTVDKFEKYMQKKDFILKIQ